MGSVPSFQLRVTRPQKVAGRPSTSSVSFTSASLAWALIPARPMPVIERSRLVT